MKANIHPARRWRIGELASVTGLTVRALHHYDETGLLKPSDRTPAGHRIYDQDDVARLYRILALRDLGLSLEDIAKALDADGVDLRRTITRHLAKVEEQIALSQSLHEKLVGILETLAAETQASADDLLDALEVMKRMERYYTPEQLQQLEERRAAYGDEAIRGFEKRWADLIAEVERHQAAGTDPADPDVQRLGDEWQGLIDAFTGGDAGITASLNKMYEEQGPEKASRGMVKPELMDYVGRILAARRTR